MRYEVAGWLMRDAVCFRPVGEAVEDRDETRKQKAAQSALKSSVLRRSQTTPLPRTRYCNPILFEPLKQHCIVKLSTTTRVNS